MPPGIKRALKFLVALAVPFAAFFGYFWWDIHKVELFCGDIQAGTPYASLPSLAERHGIDTKWVTAGIYDDSHKSWVLFVPAGTTFGEISCAVYHDKAKVLSTEMLGE